MCPAFSVTVLLCCRGAWPRRHSQSRAREVTEQLYGIIGPVNSVILIASGHRVASRTSQDMPMDPYLSMELNTTTQWYLYENYRTGKLIKSLTDIISAQFLTKVKKFSAKVLRDYTSENSKKPHAYYREVYPWDSESFFPSKQQLGLRAAFITGIQFQISKVPRGNSYYEGSIIDIKKRHAYY